MTRTAAPRNRTRLIGVLSLSLLAAAFGVPASAAAADTMTVPQAELRMVDVLNADRSKAGLVPLRVDTRLMTLARNRSNDMSAKNYFSHTQPDGRDIFDLIAAAKITWYGAGEIIAWNNAEGLDASAAFAMEGWMNSPSHKAIIVSKGYNYVGFGMAIGEGGKRYWAGVFLKGPDRTGAWTKVISVAKRVVDADTTKVFIRWDGNDTRLQVLTSGLRYYQIARRINGGSWAAYGTTTSETTTKYWPRGWTVEFMVRARDKAGNWSTWRTITIKT
jgi:uncharacterized protein YkwD